MVVRDVCRDDFQAITDIYAYYVISFCYSFEYTPPEKEEFQNRILSIIDRFPFFICEEEGQVLGFAYAHPFKERKAYDWICETSVYVHPDAINRGIGTILYNQLLPVLKKQGFTKVFAVLGCPNEGSERFHRKMGFTLMATFPDMGYKFDSWHDIKYYVLELNPPLLGMEAPVSYKSILPE